MILEEYSLDNTKIKFYDDYIVENIAIQKEYIDNVIVNLIKKVASPYVTNAPHLDESMKLNLVAPEKSDDFSSAIRKINSSLL